MSRISDGDRNTLAEIDGGRSGRALYGLAPETAAAGASGAEEVVLICHDHTGPAFIEEELQRLYGNVHSSLAQLKCYGGFEAVTHTYVARKNGAITAIFLFRRERRKLQVLNEGMRIDDEEAARFADYIFAHYPSVHLISFHAIRNEIRRLRYPHQRRACTAEVVVPLPASVDEYVAGLGKNMRRNLRRYMDKLKQDFPSFRFEVLEKEAIDEHRLRAIIDLNRTRIAGKNRIFSLDDEIERIVALAKTCGLVGVATIDGRVCAGGIGYRVGDNYQLKIIAHDPAYNQYSAGILCSYLTICACIARGSKEFNFMWTEYDYKFALGAATRALDHVTIYRSRLRMLTNAGTVAAVAAAGYRHKASALLEKADREEQLSPDERRALHALLALRRAKRLMFGLLGRN